ncbi:MAG: N-acetylmuramoyl-L-alanine amidase [Bacteroidetes bacterium]|nr:N-acetylmuramoyl-L-alanine amidase [Bacteroidota bacterium]
MGEIITPKGIIIHCSDSPQGRGDNAETIHQWHTERGFDGIGYHFVILEDGIIENGRPTYWKGSHAAGYNDYLGICLIGIDKFTHIQLDVCAGLCSRLKEQFGFDYDKILGHYQISEKTCPNIDVEVFKKERMCLVDI